MFKRYKSPFEADGSSATLSDMERASLASPARRISPYSSDTPSPAPSPMPSPLYSPSSLKDAPPRIFDERSISKPATSHARPQHYISSPLDPIHNERKEQDSHSSYASQQERSLQSEIPDTTLGEGVCFKGELTFQHLLRIDGQFEGELVSHGKLIVGPKGIVKSNIKMREAIIEGKVIGNISVQERLELRGEAQVRGNIEARYLSVDEGVTIVGHLSVNPEGAAAEEAKN